MDSGVSAELVLFMVVSCLCMLTFELHKLAHDNKQSVPGKALVCLVH